MSSLYNNDMVQKVWQKTINKLAMLIFCVALLFVFIPITAFAVDRYQILKIGDKDDYVLDLQNRLKELGFFSGTTTGYFGTKTQQAVMDYQTVYSLSVDGKAGPETLSLIMGDDYEISAEERDYLSSDTNTDYPEPGDKGTAVSDIQTKLKELEYYDYPSITGYYGPVTKTAVQLFQNTNGLIADGITGAETMKLLFSDNAKYYCIYPGDSGANVEKLQTRLKELGYFNNTVTGYFGSVTMDALKEFQAQNGLAVDAKAGKETRAILYSDEISSWDGCDRVFDESTSVTASSLVDTMIAFANDQLGKPYVYSTEGPTSFDCSGYVYYVLKYIGISINRCSADGFSKVESWTKISDYSALIPGDILFFKSDSSSRINHTGIYLGDNTFIHASSSSGSVTISNISDYYELHFCFARRIF